MAVVAVAGALTTTTCPSHQIRLEGRRLEIADLRLAIYEVNMELETWNWELHDQ